MATTRLPSCLPLRRLAGPLTVVVSRTGMNRAWVGAWVLLRRFLEYLLEITREHERGRAGGGRARRGGGGGRVGNGHYHHVGAAASQQRQRWMPGRRVAAVASLTLLASYRRYQVRVFGLVARRGDDDEKYVSSRSTCRRFPTREKLFVECFCRW